MRPRYLFGIFRIERYEYLWGHTMAQIELMMHDTPIVVYKADENKPKPGQEGFKRTAAQANAAYQKWLDRQRKEKEKGIKVSLDNFMENGEDALKK